MNHTRFPKEDHLQDWALRDNKVKKGDRVEYVVLSIHTTQWHGSKKKPNIFTYLIENISKIKSLE